MKTLLRTAPFLWLAAAATAFAQAPPCPCPEPPAPPPPVWFGKGFSYYGMRTILVLYMVSPVAQGGLGFDTKRAASLYGTYTLAVYLTALPGGLIAERTMRERS
ncbi:MAG: hypothetical protein WEB59_07615 [Thermoanaerobaculia bacterium]